MIKYIIQDENLEYVSKIIDETITLRRSNSELWASSARGEAVFKLEDHGNGVKINGGNINLDLDYSQILQLHILLRLKFETDSNMSNEIIIK